MDDYLRLLQWGLAVWDKSLIAMLGNIVDDLEWQL